MQLSRLSIRNFRVIKEATVEFSDKVIGIVGRNGAGKSSLIEAIAWAFYGNQAARTGRDEIQSIFASPADRCEVDLTFSIHEQPFRVVRRLYGASGRGEVELFRGNAAESLGVRETDKYIRDLLGLDLKGFSTSFLARQQELSALSDIPTSERRDHLAGMLGIERLDKAIKRVKEDGKLSGERVVFYERQLHGQETLNARLAELTRRLDMQRLRLPQLEEAKRKSEQEVHSCTGEVARLQELQSATILLQTELSSWLRIAAEQGERSRILSTELSDLEKLSKEIAQLKEAIAVLPTLTEKALQAQEWRVQSANRAVRLDKKKELETTLVELTGTLERANQKKAAIEKEIAAFPLDAAARFEQVDKEIQSALNEYSSENAKLIAARQALEKIAGQLSSIHELGADAVCDRCLRPMGTEYERITAHLKDEQRELNDLAATLDKQLNQLKQRGADMRAEKNALEQFIRNEHRLTLEKQAVEDLRGELAKRYQETDDRLTAVVTEISALPDDKSDFHDFANIEETINSLRQKEQAYIHGKGKLERQSVLTGEFNQVQQKVIEADRQIDEIKTKLGQGSVTDEMFDRAKKALGAAQQEYEQRRTEYESVVREIQVTETDLRGVAESLEQLAKITEKLETERETLFYGKKLDLLLVEFRKQLIAGIRPALADLSGRLMAEMTEGRYGLVELDADYNLRVIDYGKSYGINRFSGGEKDLANLCLRLAISLALTESAGLNRSFIILDEIFGSQDDTRRDLIIQAMGNLKQRFPQILLVTHVDDIKGQVEETIEVVPTVHGWSEVKQIGA